MRTASVKILALLLASILTGCSNAPEDKSEPRFDLFGFIDFGLTLQDTLLDAYKSDLNLSTDLLEDSYLMMERVESMADRITTSERLAAEFITLLTKEHTFNHAYSGIFSLNPNYDANTSFFTMNSLNPSKIYMLVSSSTRLFVPETTIKTLFNDNSSLNAAWQRTVSHHLSGNIYLNIYEIEADGTVQRTGTPAVIPASVIAAF